MSTRRHCLELLANNTTTTTSVVEFETCSAESSSDMEFYSQHDDKMMTSIYDLHYPCLEETGGSGNTDGFFDLSISSPSKDEDESQLFEEFISLVVDKASDQSGDCGYPAESPGSGLMPEATTPFHQLTAAGGGGLHQSSSCSSLYTLAGSPSDQENIQPGQKRLLYASVGLGVGGSRVQSLPRAKLNMKRENSLLRQQLQGQLSPVQYRRVQESCQCSLCGNVLSAKCILKTCLKSDEILCTNCGRELTTKCILGSCQL